MLAQAHYHYSVLPDRIATHFGISGTPDAWGTKTAFFLWYAVTTVFLASVLLWTPRMLSKIPTALINLPNKDYWLAPERKDETIAYIGRGMLLFGSGTLLFLLDIIHQSFQVSMGQASSLNHVWVTFAIYLAFCVFWTVALFRRFGGKH
jgi:hypothetical protein